MLLLRLDWIFHLTNFYWHVCIIWWQGSISRQEAVSMIPPMLMDVKPHHKVYTIQGNVRPRFIFASQWIIFLLAGFLLTFTVKVLNEHFIFLDKKTPSFRWLGKNNDARYLRQFWESYYIVTGVRYVCCSWLQNCPADWIPSQHTWQPDTRYAIYLEIDIV